MRWAYCKLVRSTHNGKPANWVEVLGQSERVALGTKWADIAQMIAQLGEQEWELVTITSHTDVVQTLDPANGIAIYETDYHFKRPMPSP
jgi:hypothetical protein